MANQHAPLPQNASSGYAEDIRRFREIFVATRQRMQRDMSPDILDALVYGTRTLCPVVPQSTRLEMVEEINAGTSRYRELVASRGRTIPALREFFRQLEPVLPKQYRYKGVCRSCCFTPIEFISYVGPFDHPEVPLCQTCKEKK